jgi:hypothetical protein
MILVHFRVRCITAFANCILRCDDFLYRVKDAAFGPVVARVISLS